MARRKKGRNVSGWLIVDKPAGIGSTTVVGKVRWAFDARKAGHAGTLDPSATGLLAIALGEATKTVPYVTGAEKCYDFTVRFGEATNTDDAEGEVTARSDIRPDNDAIRDALQAFRGDIMQVPPLYSAVRIDGVRAYTMARDGEEPELASRPLHVSELEMTDRPDDDHATFRMVCGKGGYVRSVARDLGESLGCLGHVTTLRRVWSGPFDLDDAATLDEIESMAREPELDEMLLPLETALDDLPEVLLSSGGAARIRNGNPGEVIRADCEFGDLVWGSHDGRAVAVGHYKAGELHPARVFRSDVDD